ncbi:MAG TPA: HAD family phosphatase [Puia sp.]|nr:HAD family phosphatase [Puia sp.]
MAGEQAFIFDLNGTMIDDMQYHSAAWFSILNDDLKAGLTREEVDRQMYGKNEELLDRVFGKGRFTPQELAEVSHKKELSYQAAFRPYLQLIPGLSALLEKARQHKIRMAIGSAAIPFNIDFVLDNLGIRHYFDAIVSAADVEISKPDPETFTKAARILNVPPEDCIVFEDAPKGVEAAFNAGMRAIVLTTMHEKEEFRRYPNVLRYIVDYTDPSLDELFI